MRLADARPTLVRQIYGVRPFAVMAYLDRVLRLRFHVERGVEQDLAGRRTVVTIRPNLREDLLFDGGP